MKPPTSPKLVMKKLILLAISAASLSVYALPTYEPFTEFNSLVATTGSNIVAATFGGVPLPNAPVTGVVGSAASPGGVTNGIDLATGGLTAPTGEQWTSLNFRGLNSSGTTNGAYQGVDVALVTNSSVFTYSALSSLLPSTFPGFPAPGAGITTLVENPAQQLIYQITGYTTNGSAITTNYGFAETANIAGNSAVLRFSQDITRPASGTKTIYFSYLLSVAQQGQLGAGNDGRYLGLLCQSNLTAGIGTANTYSNWFQLFNNYSATGPKYATHGLIQKTANSQFYIGPCDSSAGKSFSTSTFYTNYGAPIFVVGAYQLQAASSSVNDTNAMWVNPSLGSFGGSLPPANPMQVDLIANAYKMPDIAGLVLIDRVGNGASGGVGTNYVANLMIGSTWSYVTGGPEFTNQPIASTNVNIGQSLSLTGKATAAGQSVTYRWQKISGGSTNNLTDGTGAAGGTGTVSGSGTATLTLASVSGGDTGAFQLVATASSTGYTLTSSPVVVGLADPQIISSPVSTTANYQGTASFTAQVITANGPLKYQWYWGSIPLNNGTQPDGSSATGASGTTAAGTSFTLTLNLAGVSYQDIGSYTLYATNTLSLSGSTIPATLTVNDPIILSQPANPSAAAGGNANFTVVAAGSTAPSTTNYQWFEGTAPSGTPLSDGGTTVGGTATVAGSQTPTLTLTGIQDADNGSYYCQITGSGSGQTTNSTEATLAVGDPLTVVATPVSLTERVGDHLAFTVDVLGGGPQFQWYGPQGLIPGATSSALVLTNIQPSSAGTYRVAVGNAATAFQSYSATLTVINSPVLPLYSTNIIVARLGDGAQTLSGATGNTLYLDQYTPNGTYVSTVQVPDEGTGQPYGTGSSASTSLPAGSPALIFQGAGSDALNAAMLTVSGGNQQFLCLAGYCEAYPFTGPDVTVGATAGTYWRGLATIDAFGIYNLAYTNSGLYSGGNHTIRSMVTLDGTNFWTTGQAGANGVKFVNSGVNSYATGNGVPTVNSSGAGPRVVQIFGTNVMFSDGIGSIASSYGIYASAATPANNSISSQLFSESNDPIDFAFSPDGLTVYITDQIVAGIQRWDTTTPGSGYTLSYTLPADPTGLDEASGLAVDFSANPTWGPGVVGAKLYATTLQNNFAYTNNSLVSVIDNGDPGSIAPTVNVLVTVGPNNALRGVRFGPAAVPPTIIAGPLSQTNFPGNSVTFSVVANGSAPFYYQWYGPSGILAGATNSNFTTNGISYASAGNYSVVVSNPAGISATNTALLTVTAGVPTILPAGLPNYKETVGDHLAWAPAINGSLPITYNWYQSGNPIPIQTGTINTLAAGNGSLVLSNIQTVSAGTYKLIVNNLYGSATNTSGGVLTVTTSLQSLFPTNLVVARIGDGAQPLSGATGNTLYLDQYTPSGGYISSIQIPDEGLGQTYGTGGVSSSNLPPGSQPLIFAGAGADAPYAAMLTLSPNQQNLTFGGYVQAYPFAGSDVTIGANQGPNWRGIATVDAYGHYALNYTNTGLYSQGLHTIHSAVDVDGNGTNFYTTGQAGGGNGLKYCNVDNMLWTGQGIVSVGGSFSGSRVAEIVNGNLVFSDLGGSPVGIYGFSGLPTAGSTAGLLIAETNSPMDFAVSPDGSTVYIADNGTFGGTSNPAGGIQRWDGTAPNSYTYSYTLPTGIGSTAGARGLTADFRANVTWGAGVNGAKLYVTTAEASGNRLISIVDNGPASAATTLATASPGQVLSGVRFGPVVVPPSFATQPQSATPLPGATATFSAGLAGSGPFTYQWYFQAGGVGAFTAVNAATNATYTIGSVAHANAGNYYVIATSLSSTTAQSQTASLSLVTAPHFTSENYLGIGLGFEVFFTGTMGLSYSIYATTDLTLGQSGWTLLTTGTTSGGTDNYTDPNGGNSPQQFYIITSP